MLTSFLTIAFIHFMGVIMPGQDFIGITRFSLQNKLIESYKYALGIAIGQSVYIFLSIFGIMQILFQFKIINQLFLLFSGLYLIYLGYLIVISKIETNIEKVDRVVRVNPIKSGFIITISNPKSPIFYSSILANFIDGSSSVTFLIAISVYMSIATFVIFCGVVLIFDKFRNKMLKYVYYLEKLFALSLWYFGAKLLIKLV